MYDIAQVEKKPLLSIYLVEPKIVMHELLKLASHKPTYNSYSDNHTK